jgi:hypothetical protein
MCERELSPRRRLVRVACPGATPRGKQTGPGLVFAWQGHAHHGDEVGFGFPRGTAAGLPTHDTFRND